jgi:nicotinate-nucleotide adenylyltransferase
MERGNDTGLTTRIGIMGGTFDPIHYGHLFIAEEARLAYGLAQVVFLPNGNPPHKEGSLLSPALHRFAMTELAVQTNPFFVASESEIQRKGVVYTYDTLALFRAQYPDTELYYITGIDTVLELETWYRPDEVLNMAIFVAAARPGYEAQSLSERLPASFCERIALLPDTWMDISSTDIRNRVQQGRAIRYLTPDSVVDYIAQHNLYR